MSEATCHVCVWHTILWNTCSNGDICKITLQCKAIDLQLSNMKVMAEGEHSQRNACNNNIVDKHYDVSFVSISTQ